MSQPNEIETPDLVDLVPRVYDPISALSDLEQEIMPAQYIPAPSRVPGPPSSPEDSFIDSLATSLHDSDIVTGGIPSSLDDSTTMFGQPIVARAYRAVSPAHLRMPLSSREDLFVDPLALTPSHTGRIPSSLDNPSTISGQPIFSRARRTVSRRAREALEESNSICNICENEISDSSSDLLCCDGPSCDEKVSWYIGIHNLLAILTC